MAAPAEIITVPAVRFNHLTERVLEKNSLALLAR